MILNMKTKDPKGNFFAESKDLFVYFALIQSTFRLFKGQQYLNNMLRINK